MSEWRECKLGDVATFKTGKLNSNAETSNGIYPFFTCSPETLKIDNYAFDEETLLLAGNNANGVFSLKYYKGKFNAYQRTYLIGIKEINHHDYKFLFFSLKLQLSNLEHVSHGTATKFLTLPILNGIPFFHPELPEQKAIAAVLSSLDDKIDLLHRQNKTLESMAETLFKQWFDGEDCNGTIAQLLTIQNGYAFKSKDFNEQGEYAVLKIKNISASIVDIKKTDFISSTVSNNTPERFKVNTGDILIAMTGAEIGKLGIVPKTNKVLWLNQRVGLLREQYKGSKYLAYLQLKSEFGQDYIQNTATGSAQPNISGTGIENCGFPFISEDKIKEYSEEIDSFYEKLIFNLGQIQTLETLRDNLLPKLMSGEVRVNL